MDEKEMQENVVMYKLLDNMGKDLQKQMKLVQNKLAEVEATRLAIEEIKKVKEGNEILIPVGNGVYGYGKIATAERVLVNIGANILLEKTPSEAEEFMAERREELLEASGKIERDMKKIVERMNEIADAVNRASAVTKDDNIKVG